ncbi:MAG: hypothetical protein P8Z36_05535 [Gemmatimonadota bacterium]
MDRFRFLEELKRRHVYKVAAVYAVVAWVVIQIAATALPYLLDRPDPVIRVVIILSLVGFPVALVLGWIFDVTPQGVQRTDTQPRTPTPQARTEATPNRARVVAVGSLFVAAVAVGFALWYVRENTARPAPQSSFDAMGADLQKQVQQKLQGLNLPRSDTTAASGAPNVAAMPDIDSVASIAGAAMAGFGGLVRARGPMPASMKHVAVFPFQVPGLNADAKWGRLAADSLAAALTGAGHPAVDDDDVRKAVDAAQPDPDDRAAYAGIARQLGADAFVTGHVIPEGASVVLEIAFSGTDTPQAIRSATAVMPADALGRGFQRLAARLTTASDSSGIP